MADHPTSHGSHNRDHDPDDKRTGILGFMDRISEVREGVGSRIRQGLRDTGEQITSGAGLIDAAMRHIGDNPLDFLPGTGEAMALQDASENFQQGNVPTGLLALAGAIPGVPRFSKLFSEMAPLRNSGLRVFARSEGPGIRTVASITPNPKKPGAVKVSLFDESAEHGASELPTNTLDFDSIEDAVEAFESRPSLKGFNEVNLAQPEMSFERATGRAAFQQAQDSGDPGLLRAAMEGDKRPGGFGGFSTP